MALESYDVCIGLLQSKPKTTDGKHYTINLPNLHVDAAISVEEVGKYWKQRVSSHQYAISQSLNRFNRYNVAKFR